MGRIEKLIDRSLLVLARVKKGFDYFYRLRYSCPRALERVFLLHAVLEREAIVKGGQWKTKMEIVLGSEKLCVGKTPTRELRLDV